ncbi:unnamed protein product [Phytophthora lilii]|uniref:Unnamed protein product n=1 Tax=Phytophthora lilii TaxID=2077276 RepID=A0A9W6UCI2_9STRA|nr:unnamed protein product [Phytophthora lilii]
MNDVRQNLDFIDSFHDHQSLCATPYAQKFYPPFFLIPESAASRKDAFSVEVDEGKTVDDLKKTVKAEQMYNFPANQLRLFLAKTADGAWLTSRSEDIKKLKKGEKTALIEALMKEDQELQAEDSLDEHRRKRWRELNKILDKNKKAKTNGDDGSSTGYAYVRWSEVKSVLDYERYKHERKPIPDHAFDFLIKYLKYAAEAMNGYTDASREAKRYHFIAPVLIMLCSLFVDVKLEVAESVDGNKLHANGNFKFLRTRAVADREGLFVVYGIVTDFMKWQLYRCGGKFHFAGFEHA